MTADQQTFERDLGALTQASLEWCWEHAEEAGQRLAGTLDHILGDAYRVANSSVMSRKALESIREQLGKDGHEAVNLRNLLSGFRRLVDAGGDVSSLAAPLLDALQMQRTLSESLQGYASMMDVWIRERARSRGRSMSRGDDDRIKKELHAQARTESQRELVRKYFG